MTEYEKLKKIVEIAEQTDKFGTIYNHLTQAEIDAIVLKPGGLRDRLEKLREDSEKPTFSGKEYIFTI